jgi:hypothetical protein
MPSDDFAAVAYRILRYLDACQKAGASPDEAQLAVEVSQVNHAYYASVMRSLVDKGFVSGVRVDDYINGTTAVLLDVPRITIDGAEYLAENSRMRKAAKACGAAFERLVSTLVPKLL